MDKKTESKNLEHIFFFFLIVSILPLFYFVLLVDKNLIDNDFYLFRVAQDYIGLSFENLQTIYLTLFVTFIGVYFTVLGIFLSDKKVAFVDFYKFIVDEELILGLISLLLQFFEIVIIFSLFQYVILTEIFIYTFIIYLLFFSVYLVSLMTVIQDYNKCLEKFLNFSTKKDAKDKLKEFYESFVCKCFEDKKIDFLNDFFDKQEIDKTEKSEVLKLYLEIIVNMQNSENLEREFIEKSRFIIRRIADYLQEKNIDENNSTIKKLIDNYFALYKKFIYLHKCKYSYLLEIRDVLFFEMLDNPSDENLINYYRQLIKNSCDIIYLSLYHQNENVINQEIKDFIYFIQFFELHKELDGVTNFHSHVFLNIFTHLVNCIKIRGKNLNVLRKFITQLNDIKKIEIDDYDLELFEEENVHISVYNPIDTRNYYIGLLLCYYYSVCGKEKLESLINKLVYYKDEKLIYWQYANILTALENDKDIDNIKFCNLFSIKYHRIDYLGYVKKLLKEKIDVIKNEQINDLETKDVAKKLNDEIERQIKEIEKQFNCFNNKTKFIGQKASIETNLCISKKSLTEKSLDMILCGSNYYSLSEAFLYSKIMRFAKMHITPIKKLDDIDILDKDDKLELYLPFEYYQYIYSSRIKNVEYTSIYEIKVNDCLIKFHFINCNYGLILRKKDFESHIQLKNIEKLNAGEWIKQGEDFIKNINIRINFLIDTSNEITCYRLEY